MLAWLCTGLLLLLRAGCVGFGENSGFFFLNFQFKVSLHCKAGEGRRKKVYNERRSESRIIYKASLASS